MKKLNLILIVIAVQCTVNFGFAQVGINTTTPLSTLDINGNLTIKEIGIVNANVAGSAPLLGSLAPARTAIDDGVYISITPTGTANDFELPNAVNVPGRIYIVRNISNCCYAFIFSAGGGFFAKNDPNVTSQPLTMAHNLTSKTIIFISDGINWTYIF
jgi:hypothetical protein